MLPINHKDRTSIIKLRENINSLIIDLKKAKHDLNYLLDQDCISDKDEMLLESVNEKITKSKFVLGSIVDYDNYKMIESNHPIKSFTPEKTYRRDLSYSLFHRSFSRECYTLDLDFLEMRKDINGKFKPVLLYDVKRNIPLNDNLKKWNRGLVWSLKMYKDVADMLSIPLQYVNYKPDMSNLTVSNIYSIEPLEMDTNGFTPEEYRLIIEGL